MPDQKSQQEFLPPPPQGLEWDPNNPGKWRRVKGDDRAFVTAQAPGIKGQQIGFDPNKPTQAAAASKLTIAPEKPPRTLDKTSRIADPHQPGAFLDQTTGEISAMNTARYKGTAAREKSISDLYAQLEPTVDPITEAVVQVDDKKRFRIQSQIDVKERLLVERKGKAGLPTMQGLGEAGKADNPFKLSTNAQMKQQQPGDVYVPVSDTGEYLRRDPRSGKMIVSETPVPVVWRGKELMDGVPVERLEDERVIPPEAAKKMKGSADATSEVITSGFVPKKPRNRTEPPTVRQRERKTSQSPRVAKIRSEARERLLESKIEEARTATGERKKTLGKQIARLRLTELGRQQKERAASSKEGLSKQVAELRLDALAASSESEKREIDKKIKDLQAEIKKLKRNTG